MSYLGDFIENSSVRLYFTTNNSAGAAVAPSSAFEVADVVLYKNGSDTQRNSTSGWTMTSPFDSVVGLHLLEIDLSDDDDAGFYAAGNDYAPILNPDETVDSQVVVSRLEHFSIQNRYQGPPPVEGGAQSVSAASYVLTTGTEASGSLSSTVGKDGVSHVHDDDTGVIDLYYQFSVGGDGSAGSVAFTAGAQGPTDDISIYAWDWVGEEWTPIGAIVGTALGTLSDQTLPLFAQHTQTGTGLVRIRLYDAADAQSVLVDQIFVSYVVTSRTVGYANGSIWVDTIDGTAGTEPFVNGTGDKPVLTWADALTLSDSVGIKRFQIINGSEITLSDVSDNFTLLGTSWALDLNGKSIDGFFAACADATGTGTNGDFPPEFKDCHFHDAIIPPCHADHCGFEGTFTIQAEGMYYFDSGHSMVAGTDAPIFDYGAGLNASQVNWRRHSGGIKIKNMGAGTGTYLMSLEGHGQLIIDETCTGGTIAIRGHFKITGKEAFIAAGGVIDDDANFDPTRFSLAMGTAQGGSSNSIQLAATETFADDEPNGCTVAITHGLGAGQARQITNYVGSTDTASVKPNWTTTPDSTSVYVILPAEGALLPEIAGRRLDISAAGHASINWGAVEGQGTSVNLSGTTINNMTNKSGMTIAGSKTRLDDLNDVSQAEVTARCEVAITNQDLTTNSDLNTALSALNDISLAELEDKLQEVLGLNGSTNVLDELPAAAPSATPKVGPALMLLYMALRNKRTVTETLLQLNNDAGSAICEAGLTDAGGTQTKAELAAP